MPTIPSILRSTALTEASHNANKLIFFLIKKLLQQSTTTIKKKLHPNNFKNTSKTQKV